MVTIDQAMRGAMRFADSEIIPHLPTGKGIGAGIALALIMDGGKSRILHVQGIAGAVCVGGKTSQKAHPHG